MSRIEAEKILEWLESQNVDYGELSITLKFHNSELRHIERTIKHSDLPKPERAGGSHVKNSR